MTRPLSAVQPVRNTAPATTPAIACSRVRIVGPLPTRCGCMNGSSHLDTISTRCGPRPVIFHPLSLARRRCAETAERRWCDADGGALLARAGDADACGGRLLRGDASGHVGHVGLDCPRPLVESHAMRRLPDPQLLEGLLVMPDEVPGFIPRMCQRAGCGKPVPYKRASTPGLPRFRYCSSTCYFEADKARNRRV